VFPNNKEVTRSWAAVRAIFVYPCHLVKRQFRLGAVPTETAAEGFLLASVQSDDTPLFVTLNSVAMTRPMHRHIARRPHKKRPCLRTRRMLVAARSSQDFCLLLTRDRERADTS
jgi:hypothetical protein